MTTLEGTPARRVRQRPRGRLFALAAVVLGALLVAPSALAARGAGPDIAGNVGFSQWFQDDNNRRVVPCLDEARCLLELETPGAPVSFFDNIGPEFFWWSAEADLSAAFGVKKLILVMAVEGAFANEDPFEGDEVMFMRHRVRGEGMVANAWYKITTPYVTFVLQADGRGRMRSDIDQICTVPGTACNPAEAMADARIANGVRFDGSLQTPAVASDIGPVFFSAFKSFLRQTTATGNSMGNPLTDATVTGGPNGNAFTVKRVRTRTNLLPPLAVNQRRERTTSLFGVSGICADANCAPTP